MFTLQEFHELTQEALNNHADQGAISLVLAKLEKDYMNTVKEHSELATKNEIIGNENKELLNKNFELFSMIGKVPPTDNSKADNNFQDDTQKPDFDSLFQNGKLSLSI